MYTCYVIYSTYPEAIVLLQQTLLVRFHLRQPIQAGQQPLNVRLKVHRQIVAIPLIHLLAEPIPQRKRQLGHLVVVVADAVQHQVQRLERIVRLLMRLGPDDFVQKRFAQLRKDAAIVHGLVGVLVRHRHIVRLIQRHNVLEHLVLEHRLIDALQALQERAQEIGGGVVQLYVALVVVQRAKALADDGAVGRPANVDGVHANPRREALEHVQHLGRIVVAVVGQRAHQQLVDDVRVGRQLLLDLVAPIRAQPQVARLNLLGYEGDGVDQRPQAVLVRRQFLDQVAHRVGPLGHEQRQVGEREAQLRHNDRTGVDGHLADVRDQRVAQRDVRIVGQFVEGVLDFVADRLGGKVAGVQVALLLQQLVGDLPREHL